MSNFLEEGSGSTLADVLGATAKNAATGISDSYAKRRKREADIAGANGRLNSGVQNYTTADTSASELGDLGQVQSNLASSLAGIPASDILSQQGNNQNNALAELIARLSKPSDLQQALGLLGAGAKTAGTVAAFI